MIGITHKANDIALTVRIGKQFANYSSSVITKASFHDQN